MKILFYDEVRYSTVTSVNASLNYPAENIQSSFLRKRYQSSINTDLITIDFGAEYPDINCFFYGFTDATSLVLRLYDGSGVLLYTQTVSSPVETADAYHFDTVFSVDYATIEIAGGQDVYLGGVGLGLSYQMPGPFGIWTEVDTDNSTSTRSPTGQSLQNYIEPLEGQSFRWRDIEREVFQEIRENVRDVGIGLPVWVDFFEYDHDFMMPNYVTIDNPFSVTKNGRRYNFNMQFQEAR